MWPQDQQQQYLAAPFSQPQEPLSTPSEHAVDSLNSPMLSSPSTIHPSPIFPRKASDSDFSSSTALGQLFLRPPSSPSIPPDSPQFPDSYTYRPPHQRLVPPPLSSADSSSASTRSSAYTNFGSGVASLDYGHVVVANGEDDPSVGVGITSDEVVQLLGQHSSSSSSRTPVDAPTRWSQLQSGPRSRSSSAADSRTNSLALSSSSKPGSDGDWRAFDEREETALTSESETDDDACLDSDDEGGDEEEEPTSAMIIAEEGRGVIVRGEGGSVHNIQAPSG